VRNEDVLVCDLYLSPFLCTNIKAYAKETKIKGL